MPVAAPGRRPDRDEDRFGRLDRVGEVGREREPPLAHVLGDEVREARLENRNLAAVQRLDLARILVDAAHVVSEVCKQAPETRPT